MRWTTPFKWLLLAAAVYAAWWYGPWRSISHPAGVLVATEPRQELLPGHPLPDVEGWKLRAFAKYELRGRVLGTKRYYSGSTADIVPVDVAVGWGPMSDSKVLDNLSLSMGNRFFFYEWENQPPIGEKLIIRSAANNHIISANAQVRSAISSLREGHLVLMTGYLVDATLPGEGSWSSSRRRDDTGNGACELFYVETVKMSESVTPEFAGPAPAVVQTGIAPTR